MKQMKQKLGPVFDWSTTQRCACGEPFEAASFYKGPRPGPPELGSLTVCGYCGALYQVAEGNQLKKLDEIPKELTAADRQAIHEIRAALFLGQRLGVLPGPAGPRAHLSHDQRRLLDYLGEKMFRALEGVAERAEAGQVSADDMRREVERVRNGSFVNERRVASDLGWTPEKTRRIMAELVALGLAATGERSN